MRHLISLIVIFSIYSTAVSQSDTEYSIKGDLLITYGNMCPDGLKEGICSQTLFIVVPEQFKNSFYIRVFDPDCGGENDAANGLWETNTEFEFYGGKGCVDVLPYHNTDQQADRTQGTLLQKKLFANEPSIDNSWVTFGPFMVEQGEKLEGFSHRFFKLVVGGKTGNDGNHYAVSISASGIENSKLAGASMYNDEIALSSDLQGGKYNYSVVAEPLDE